ncbi:MAG: ABC transporter ATP-binding protein [Spirochaetales bacterium]|nr:ABC transporter ATP-binding protein [Spirochaetales bacterium]MCF7939223.1 ABC transporter ATP-binding protein [Spirochaetales bacterium]
MSKLVLQSLTKRFGGLVAVNGVDLEMTEGEILGIIGPNGAGKTTLINLISGIHVPTSGNVFFDGKDISTFPAHERSKMGIARTFQLIHPLENLTALQNVMIGFMFAQGMNQKDAGVAAQKTCESLKLEHVERDVGQLTILETKKMEIAKTLACGPKVLFLDEVMAGLNSDETKDLIETVKRIAQEHNLAIGVVEHVMGVIKMLTARVIVLDAGEIIAQGPYNEVSQKPEVIKAYLGGEA